MSAKKVSIMGIQYLNSYMRNKVDKEAIYKINFSDLANKIIAIDASIYLYRFLSEDCLLENIYLMVALMKHYNIIPIFVFDGKAPMEKQKLLKKRNQVKILAEKQHDELTEKLDKITNITEKQEIQEHIQNLKRKFVRLKRTDIKIVQDLLTAFGVTYIEAKGEADELCARLVLKKRAFACLSEDMDMFLYGCPRVLRYLSLLHETIILYDLDKILNNLNLTFIEFKEICVLSGTDYNCDAEHTLHNTITYFNQYKNFCNTTSCNLDFYTWLDKYYSCIDNIYELYNAFNMFHTDNMSLREIMPNKLVNETNMNEVKKIMTQVGFIFVEKEII